ncbi:MAG: HU family DNA-binding protein [Rhodobacteraceae bacterium]|nr:HU family DNA-binding protein [Paracoccaceae bacterium]
MEKKTVVKQDIIKHIAVEAGVTQSDAKQIVQQVFDETIEGMLRDETVFIPKFGKFNVQHKVARPARVPKTGEPVTVSARRRPSFKPSRLLKARINS